MLGLWPLIALAERARNHLVSGAAIAGATVLGGLAVLGQARAIVPAIMVSAIVLVAVLPGRRQRLWALVAVGCGVGLAAGPLVDVYESGKGGGLPDPDTVRSAILLCSAPAHWRGRGALVRWGAARAGGSLGRGRLARLSAAGLAAIALVALVGALAAAGNPADRVRDEWHAFKTPGAAATPIPLTVHHGIRQPLRLLARRLPPIRGRAAQGRRGRQLRPHLLPRAPHERGHPPAPQPAAAGARGARDRRACSGCCCSWARCSPASLAGPGLPGRAPLTSGWPSPEAGCSSSGWCIRASTGCT